MPTTIRTEQARVALAHHEYRQSAAETERKLNARARVLKRDPRAVYPDSYLKLCAADPEFCELVIMAEGDKVGRDGVIRDRRVATIEDAGEVRWTLPQCTGKPS
jgi:hypothetical protein